MKIGACFFSFVRVHWLCVDLEGTSRDLTINTGA